MWAVWNVFFLIGSLPLYVFPSERNSDLSISAQQLTSHRNLVYIGIFFKVQMAFTLVAASYFAAADGHASGSVALTKAGGEFAFLPGLSGYYTVGNLMCQEALRFLFPMGDTGRFFARRRG